MYRIAIPILVCLLGVPSLAWSQQPAGTAFTYQGLLEVGNRPADGTYDIQFRLYDASVGGDQIGAEILETNIVVTKGILSVVLDFALVLGESARWLEISVAPSATQVFETLTPRQEILPAPHAGNAQRLEGLTASELLAQGVPNPLILSGSGSGTIQGTTTSITAGHAGVVGRANSFSNTAESVGVLGTSTSFSSESVGVYGLSPQGRGVYGLGAEFSGQNYGVYGETLSPDGHAGYFVGGKNYFEGNLGIGTDDPELPLTLRAPNGVADVGITQGNLGAGYTMEFMTRDELGGFRTRMMLRGNSGDQVEFFRGNAGQEQLTVIIDNTGYMGIGTATPQNMLDVAGTTRTNILQIDGGSDLSEGFGLTDEAEPGMVVVIDETQPGQLRRSSDPYDHRVAGIVSGAGGINPGMLMGQAGSIADGEYPVALTGRVYCLVDADGGAILPGDLLTTSGRPGHAMKVIDRDRAGGATLGKAMTGLDSGQGLVLVLVGLQ